MKIKKGFTLVEIIISLVAFAIVVGAVLQMFFQGNSLKETTQELTEMQQLGRNAVDFLSRDLREAGYGIDLTYATIGKAQIAIAYADKYTLVFNANIAPANDSVGNPQPPMAVNPDVSDSIPLSTFGYIPDTFYTTGAETYVYTLDIDHDGDVDMDDANYPNSPAAKTPNPYDFTLVRYVYGYDPSEGNNLRSIDYVGIVDASDSIPIFWYWYDNDTIATNPTVLFGDSNGDGRLSATEAMNITRPLTYSERSSLDKITLHFTVAGSKKLKTGNYPKATIMTTVALNRNLIRRTYPVRFHAYHDNNENGAYDPGEPGIPDSIIISLNSGDIATTDDQGITEFSLPSGVYVATASFPARLMPTTSTVKEFKIYGTSGDYTNDDCFGFKDWDVGRVEGYVYYDKNLNGEPDIGVDSLLNGIEMSGLDSVDVVYTHYNYRTGYDGYFESPEKCYLLKKVSPMLGDTLGLTGAQIWRDSCYNVDDSTINSDYTVSFKLGKDGRIFLLFGVAPVEGEPGTLQIKKPEPHEAIQQGEKYTIEWFADGIDDPVQGVWLYYSADRGKTWKDIDYVTGNGDVQWNGSYVWDIDTSYHVSSHALLRLRMSDEGRNIAEDTVEFILSPRHGFHTMKFQRVYTDPLIEIPRPSSWDSISENTDLDDTLYAKLISPTLWEDTLTGVAFMTIPEDSDYWLSPLVFADLETPSEWGTPLNIPNADTVFQGTWKFVIYGAHDDEIEDDDTRHYYRNYIRISKRNWQGDPESDTVIFDSRPGRYRFNVDSIWWGSYLTTISDPETIWIRTISPSRINPTDRLYVKMYIEAKPVHSNYDDNNVHVYFNPYKPDIYDSRFYIPAFSGDIAGYSGDDR